MGPQPWKWFLPIRNSMGNGIVFPVSEDVRRILRGMRSDLSRMQAPSGTTAGESVFEDEDEERVYRRDANGNWMVHS